MRSCRISYSKGVVGDSMNIVGGTNSETLTAATRCEETEIVSGEDGKSKSKMEALETSKEVSGEEEPKEISSSESGKHTWVIEMIDIKCDGNSRSLSDENLDREKVCRICHLSSDQTSSGSVGLIQLGCDCKDELGISHRYCAEAWFKRKGNRKCEICGGTAKNITGIEDTDSNHRGMK
ncbi:hypothetical protein L1049_024415 [Liquidambar formosana]|uniref:RING-CH-type domain-containing protein n=1 Tax=Liquidambar formosana TaxID=63359 RepID=A0AAP0S0W3_LIQFO